MMADALSRDEVMAIFRERLGDEIDSFEVPPPSFQSMEGAFLEIDVDRGHIKTRFPVLPDQLNPYGAMQGGMITAAIDNTIGPLSMLYDPPNVTRRMELKFSRPVTPAMGFVFVDASFQERKGSWLHFRADVRSEQGALLARCFSTHWILAAGTGTS